MAYEDYEKLLKDTQKCYRSGLINNANLLNELQQVYRKAKAFDRIKKHVDEEGDSFMVLYRETKDPFYSLLNNHYDTLLGYIEELERADDEK